MECRICKQPISFVKVARPGQSRKAIVAVHDHELSQALAETHGEVVTPHPGNQRKLRMALEHSHQRGQEAAQPKTGDVRGEAVADQPSPQPAIPKSEIPGADVINQPIGQPMGQPMGQPIGQPIGQPTGQPTGQPAGAAGAAGEQTDEQRDARRSASY